MLEWMLYVSVVSTVLALGAVAGERSARLWRLPCRWLWCAALGGSMAIALFAWLAPGAPELADPVPLLDDLRPGVVESGAVQYASTTADLRQRLPGLDRMLGFGWLVLSLATLAALGLSARDLVVRRRSCVAGRVNGRRVLLSDQLGPAVVGFIRPAIVLPRWVLETDPGERRLIIAHEEEHLFAGDQRIVGLSLLALVITPWNPALWWSLHRLRQAIELDCDQRVLRGGCDVAAYGNLILRASLRPSVASGYGSPFGEPAVSLERRIIAMVTTVPRFRRLHGAIAGSLSVLLTLAACSIDRPSALANPVSPPGSAVEPLEPARTVAPPQDGRVSVNRVSSVPDRATTEDVVVLEVKAGPSYLINELPVPVPELRSFLASVFGPRPRKVLFVRAASGVSDREMAEVLVAARAGLGEALDSEKTHGRPGVAATINVVVAAAAR